MDNETYNEQLKTQKEKTKALKDNVQMHDMHSSNPLTAGLGGLGALSGLGALGGLGLLGNQTSGLLTMLNTKGGDPINSSVFVSNVSVVS